MPESPDCAAGEWWIQRSHAQASWAAALSFCFRSGQNKTVWPLIDFLFLSSFHSPRPSVSQRGLGLCATAGAKRVLDQLSGGGRGPASSGEQQPWAVRSFRHKKRSISCICAPGGLFSFAVVYRKTYLPEGHGLPPGLTLASGGGHLQSLEITCLAGPGLGPGRQGQGGAPGGFRGCSTATQPSPPGPPCWGTTAVCRWCPRPGKPGSQGLRPEG